MKSKTNDCEKKKTHTHTKTVKLMVAIKPIKIYCALCNPIGVVSLMQRWRRRRDGQNHIMMVASGGEDGLDRGRTRAQGLKAEA